ncbi:hypothetical protein BGX20_000881 [Mortierella sp. AD010]|nr:hypothetical protein BGX20_000881 [Mortierella sp. AD010]
MFPEFHGLLAFVHTHFDYKNHHPQMRDVVSHLTAKKGVLNKMMERDTCKHFEIDCDVNSTRLIRIGITQNIIRNILSLAPFNVPVAINRVLIMKSPRMRVMDNVLADKLKAILESQRKVVDSKDGAQGAILQKLYEMETRLNSLRSEERDLEEYIKEYNTDDLVMLEELMFDQQWRFFQFNKDHSMNFPKQEHIIHKKNILSENVDISKEQGGEGHNFWNIVYKRHSYEDGTLHAKLYTTRSSIHREKISENESKLSHLRSTLQEVENELNEYSSKHHSEMADIQKLVEKSALYTQLIFRLSSERISPEVFQHLMDEKAYASKNSETVEKVYLEVINKDGTKPLDPGDQKIMNVLLLGETQFGKNTFIEFVKKYADPEYTIDFSNILSSVSSYTKEVTRSTIHTDLPITTVVENASGSNQTEVYLGSLINDSRDFDDFEGALNRRSLKTTRTQPSESITQYQFNLFGAPQDLNDTSKEDEVHIASIYQSLRRAKDVSLVLITVGMTPFTLGFQAVIKCYFDMFPEFHRLTAFVHTHVNYQDLHPSREKPALRLATRIEQLNGLIGRDSCPHFAIDCDLKTTRPIRTCITQNTIHNILHLASSNDPITVDRILIHKSPRMRDIDSILVSKYKEMKGNQTGIDSNKLISRLSNEALAPDEFGRLVDGKAYINTPSENVETVERIYLDMIRNKPA